MNRFICATAVLVLGTISAEAQSQTKKKARRPKPFRWVNELKLDLSGVKHATFKSPSMKFDVGYCIYLPPAYDNESNAKKRFPVVYYLHGGRPGSAVQSVRLAGRR